MSPLALFYGLTTGKALDPSKVLNIWMPIARKGLRQLCTSPQLDGSAQIAEYYVADGDTRSSCRQTSPRLTSAGKMRVSSGWCSLWS